LSVPDGRPPRAVVFGCAGTTLSAEEQRFFREADPFGFILFARNCSNPEQLKRLVTELRDSVQRRDAPVLIDQEGGRVARLQAPHWRHPPPQGIFAELAEHSLDNAKRAAYLNARLIGRELAAVGITVDCLPVLDLPQPGAHQIIGDRALGKDPETIAALGLAICEGLLAEGVLPVIKHLPGHGRAGVDSHKALPVVDASLETLRDTDFAPFRLLAAQPWAMTAHVVYSAIDRDHPATVSPEVISTVIRGEIGFKGLLLSDDLGMEALVGDFDQLTSASLSAGCDLALHCSGILEEMELVAKGTPPMTQDAEGRGQYAEAMRLGEGASEKPEFGDMLAEFETLTGGKC
jgi:beta-N-acetylhexosaminidase